jgi:hypothetical protein
MKAKFGWLRMFVLVAVVIGGTMRARAQQNQNPTQLVCIGVQEYHVDLSPIAGATYTWSLSGGGTIMSGNGTNTINVDWITPGGPYTLSVFTTANGCAGPPQSVDVTVATPAVGPTLLAKTPPDPTVCDGTLVSATFNPGSGGVDCTDEFEYSFDGSGTWVAYIPGDPILTTGHTLVEIHGRRSGCNAILGCTGTPWEVLAVWTISAPLPVSVTILPDLDPICAGTEVTYTAVVDNGGASPTYSWHVNGGPEQGTNSTFTYIPNVGDVITCVVTSSQACVTNNPATGTYTPVVNPQPNTSNIWHN